MSKGHQETFSVTFLQSSDNNLTNIKAFRFKVTGHRIKLKFHSFF